MSDAMPNVPPCADVAILANGERPTHGIPLRIFRDAGRVIACDGAWRTAIELGRKPDAVVGDCDSIAAGARETLAELGVPLVEEGEQDTNDLCKAFRYAIRICGAVDGRIVILGATGKREDHAIGNVFHLIDFAEASPAVSMVTDFGVFEVAMPPGRSWSVPQGGCAVSVFAPFADTRMSSEGLRWPLDGVAFGSLWRGTLNRAVGETFSIRTDRPAIVFRSHVQPDGGYVQ